VTTVPAQADRATATAAVDALARVLDPEAFEPVEHPRNLARELQKADRRRTAVAHAVRAVAAGWRWVSGPLVVLLVVSLTACGPVEPPRGAVKPPTSRTGPSSPPSSSPAGSGATSGTQQPTAPPRYDRDRFGTPWKDVDRNGCDQRNDVLARDLTGTTVKPGTRNCVVLTGTLRDPYTGATIPFTRGLLTSGAVQIDHRVALSWVWVHGADSWTDARREEFANDLSNLVATSGVINQRKSDLGPSQWLPPDHAAWCGYAHSWRVTLAAYSLQIGSSDDSALSRVEAGC
jgi:hypothetical protein